MNRRISGLYAITEETTDTARLLESSDAALRGGARAVQYRNKAGSSRLRRAQAIALGKLVRERAAIFIVNDSVELAAYCGADGVHLGRDDVSVGSARRQLGAAALIGVSCYDDLQRALDAEREGADYVAFGSFFASATKPAALRAPLELLRRARRVLKVPIVAIGGVTAGNADSLVAAGAEAIAVASALFRAADIEAEAAALVRCFGVATADSLVLTRQ